MYLVQNIYLILEYISLISGIFFVIFLVRNSPITWIFSIISVSIQILLFYRAELYFLGLRSLYYFVISVYAYITWKKLQENQLNAVPIKSLSLKQNIFYFILAILGSLTLYGLSFTTNLKFASPLLDASILAFSLVAKYIQGKRYKNNFIYYIAIDIATVVSCTIAGLYYIAILNVVFTFFAFYGYYNWSMIQKKEKELRLSS